MNFFAFEFEKPVNVDTLVFSETEDVKFIQDEDGFFVQKKYYSSNYHDDWRSKSSEETQTGYASEFDQLKEQVFIYVDVSFKHIYSNIEYKSRIQSIIFKELGIDIPIFHKLVSIEDFEDRISALTSISIKSNSLQQKALFTEDFLNIDSEIIDLSEVEEFKLDLSYKLSKKKGGIVKMYKQLIEKYNVSEIVFKGVDEDNLFQFNAKSIIHKIPVNLAKNGEGKIFDYKEVYGFLKDIIRK